LFQTYSGGRGVVFQREDRSVKVQSFVDMVVLRMRGRSETDDASAVPNGVAALSSSDDLGLFGTPPTPSILRAAVSPLAASTDPSSSTSSNNSRWPISQLEHEILSESKIETFFDLDLSQSSGSASSSSSSSSSQQQLPQRKSRSLQRSGVHEW